MFSFQKPEYATPDQFRWTTFIAIMAIHLIALGALWTFTWQAFAVGFVISLLTGSLGISFAYHRLLTHQGLKTHKWVTYLTTVFAILSVEGGPIFWTSTHRYHHKQSDKPLDPHSPRDGMFWAHMGWLFYSHPVLDKGDARARITSDLYKDPVIRGLEKISPFISIGQLPVLFAIGYFMGGLPMALSYLCVTGALRIVYVWHVTWLINSFTHKFGYRNHPTSEDSTNNPLIAMFSFGEGWHNNHHGDPRTANFWHRWFEFDLTYAAIWLMVRTGLVWDVVQPRHRKEGIRLPIPELKEPAMQKSGLTPA